MSADRRSAYGKLLRWYPAPWRRANGDVMLDTLEQHADATGRAKPSIGEAWSIRAHGVAEHATPSMIAGVSAAALLLSLIPVATLWFGAQGDDAFAMSIQFGTQFLASLFASIAGGALLLNVGIIRAESAVFAGVIAIPAWMLGGLAAASWSIGFNEADAGAGMSWFGSATGAFVVGGWFLGTIATSAIACGALSGVQSRTARMLVSLLIAAPSALVIGVAAILLQGTILAAVCTLIVAIVRRQKPQHRAAAKSSDRVSLSSTTRRSLAVATSAAAVLGVGCVLFALTGSGWVGISLNATETMRLGILSGALIAIITVIATALALHPRMGRSVIWASTVLVIALMVLAASYAGDINSPLAWPWLLIAATLSGLACALLLAPILPGTRTMRAALVAAISLALAATLGLVLITMTAFLAPLVAIIATVVLLRRPRQRIEAVPAVYVA